MRKKYILGLVLWFCVVCGNVLAARQVDPLFNDTIDRTSDDFVTASLLVVDPGDVLYSVLGHACIRMQCPTFGMDYVFTYESEDVRHRVWAFLRGRLKMGMFCVPTEDYCATCASDGRGVRAYKMHLSPEQKQDLWRVLDEQVQCGNDLPYDYYERGCAKSVVDMVERAIGKEAIVYAPWSERYLNNTMREIAIERVRDYPWTLFVLYVLVGSDVDKACAPLQKVVVPDDLLHVWQDARLAGEAFVGHEEQVLVASPTHKPYSGLTPMHVAVVLLMLACMSALTSFVQGEKRKMLVLSGKMIDGMVWVVAGAIGCVETYLVCFSSLCCTGWNWLLVPFNVLPLVCWPWRKWWGTAYGMLIVGWIVAMIAFPHRLVDPSQLVLAAAWAIVMMKGSSACGKGCRKIGSKSNREIEYQIVDE